MEKRNVTSRASGRLRRALTWDLQPQECQTTHFLGPQQSLGNGPVLVAVERQADYMLSLCDRWQTENINSFVPKEEAIRDFTEYTQELMQSTVFSDACRS